MGSNNYIRVKYFRTFSAYENIFIYDEIKENYGNIRHNILGLVSFIVGKLASYSWCLIGPKDQG